MVEKDSSKESLHNELQLASKISARLDMMHKKDMKKERNRVEEELRAATKKFSKERKSSRKNQKKAFHQIEKKRGQLFVQKEVDKSLAKEAQLQRKTEEMDSFAFGLAEEVRDANCKRRAAHKHTKHFKQLAHRWLKR